MDLRTVVTISALFLVTAESQAQTTGANITSTTFSVQTNNTTGNCSCHSAAPADISTTASSPNPAPSLGLLTIKWSKCQGKVNLILYHLSNSSSPVCHSSETNVRSLLINACENRKGCKNPLRWEKGRDPFNGYNIAESRAEPRTSCETLKVQCAVDDLADVEARQLRAYKVVTALLCCALVVLLLIRFTKPTVKALQKRLSDRRQNRWIGPTQSHSVSYHRGKTAVRNNDGEKRLSYPALERLAVSDSREPSSNRNSDFTF